jgi:hypothetical protein
VYAAEVGDLLPGGGVEQGDAVPQHVAVRGAHQQRPLPDPDGRFDADPDQVRFLVPELGGVIAGQLGFGGPLLTAPADVLPFVLTDRTVLRRPVGVGVLDGAR